MRFMIIANDQRSATTITDYCAAFDIFTDTFADAESAMHALQQNNGRYDLIIVEPDQMPGVGGYAFCSWFKQNETSLPGWQRARGAKPFPADVIVLSATPVPDTCASFGADMCFSKPLSSQCFAHAMHAWIVSRQQRRRKSAQHTVSNSSSLSSSSQTSFSGGSSIGESSTADASKTHHAADE